MVGSRLRRRHRFVAFIVAAWYFSISTGVAVATLDWIAPVASRAMARADFPCADHPCPCRTAAICRVRCCCSRDSRERPLPAAKTLRVVSRDARSVFVAAVDCAGFPKRGLGSKGARFAPHLVPSAGAVLPIRPSRSVRLSDAALPPSAAVDPSEKIPRALLLLA